MTEGPCVLKDGYSTASTLEINTKSDLNGGTALKSIFTRAAADKTTSTLKATTSSHGVSVEADLNGQGDIKAKASMADLMPGLKLAVTGHLNGGQKAKDMAAPSISAEYANGDVMATATVEGSHLSAAAVYDLGDVSVGVKSAYDSSDGSLADPSFAAKYKGAGFNIGAMLKGLKGDDIAATYDQKVNDDLSVAGSFCSAGNKFALGAAYKVDAGSAVRAKLDSDGMLNVGYKRSVTSGAELAAGLEMDTNNLDSRKVGISMKLH
mmetsp:Transcript_53472/g.127368  ORF Transcript_53472/g.127368 Transcript_53472/m.127368 type:complete len:265 (-) Transcript_53472:225-1019(-)